MDLSSKPAAKLKVKAKRSVQAKRLGAAAAKRAHDPAAGGKVSHQELYLVIIAADYAS